MIIGISGKAGSGKDLAAKIVQYLIATNRLRNTTELPIELSAISETPFHIWDRENYNNAYFSGWKVKKFAYAVKQICSILTGIPVEDFEKEEVKNSYLGEEWWYYEEWKNTIKVPYKTDFYPNMREKLESIGKVNLIKPTIRELLQKVGTDAMRDVVHPDVWVNSLMRLYKPYKETKPFSNKTSLDNKYPNWLISDVRFPNEAKAIKDRNGIIVRVRRDKVEEHICKYCEAITTQADHLCYKAPVQHESETNLDTYSFDWIINNHGTIEELIEKVKEMLTHFKIIEDEK